MNAESGPYYSIVNAPHQPMRWHKGDKYYKYEELQWWVHTHARTHTSLQNQVDSKQEQTYKATTMER